jgi:hypothetical protein
VARSQQQGLGLALGAAFLTTGATALLALSAEPPTWQVIGAWAALLLGVVILLGVSAPWVWVIDAWYWRRLGWRSGHFHQEGLPRDHVFLWLMSEGSRSVAHSDLRCRVLDPTGNLLSMSSPKDIQRAFEKPKPDRPWFTCFFPKGFEAVPNPLPSGRYIVEWTRLRGISEEPIRRHRMTLRNGRVLRGRLPVGQVGPSIVVEGQL